MMKKYLLSLVVLFGVNESIMGVACPAGVVPCSDPNPCQGPTSSCWPDTGKTISCCADDGITVTNCYEYYKCSKTSCWVACKGQNECSLTTQCWDDNPNDCAHYNYAKCN
jgi:hypothetical protein